MRQIIMNREELKQRVNDGAHLPAAINIRLAKLSEKSVASLDKKTPQSFIAMTTSETWLPEPRRGSRVLASKKFFTINRERPIGWRMDCPRSKSIESPESLCAMDHMQVELSTCRADEPVGRAGARAPERGYSVCPVVNETESSSV